MATEVAELYASLSIKTSAANFAQADAKIKAIGKALQGVDGGAKKAGGSIGLLGRLGLAGAGFGVLNGAFSKGYDYLVKFNSSVEDTRNQIAGMMALSTKTDLNDNLGKADSLLGHLRERAAKLPGTTAEYAQMLGMLTQPILDAKLGMQDLEDITVNSVVGAKALGVEWQAAARDIDQALRGQFHSTDVFTGKLLGSIGYKGETGRSQFNALSAQKRASELKRALTQKQLGQLAAAQGDTFSGRMSTFVDTLQQTLGKVGAPLFAKMTAGLQKINAWFDKNKAAVESFASTVGNILAGAFDVVTAVIDFFIDHSEIAKSALIAIGVVMGVIAAEAAIAAAPIYLITAALTGVILVVRDVWRSIKTGKGVTASVFNWIADKLDWLDGKLIAFGGMVAEPFIAIKDVFVGLAETIYTIWSAIISWISGKIAWVSSKVDWVTGKLGWVADKLGLSNSDVLSTVNVPGAAAAATVGTASRAVPSAAGTPPIVNVAAPNVSVSVHGDMNEMFNTTVDKRVQMHSENTWRNIHAATGGAETQ